ncbi:MAG TPA: hypothetical protein VE338_08970 [Ktedonobacterales bacterium]|nr:hypothetical protein [Ktedonobacterales bacterium]
MLENYEVVYTHPGGAVATFTRQDGELDALAKGLDAEQFWVFKNVKSLLARNESGDLQEATRLMGAIGFSARVREIVAPVAPVAPAREPAFAAPAVESHTPGIHLPGPSYWPLVLAVSVGIAFSGVFFWTTTLLITALGLVLALFAGIAWSLETV